MAKGKQLEFQVTYWPRKKESEYGQKTPEGEEIHGIYRGLVHGEYKGKPKETAVIEGRNATWHIGSGAFTKIIASKLQVDASYYIKFVGLKDTENGEAFQFEVYEDDGKP